MTRIASGVPFSNFIFNAYTFYGKKMSFFFYFLDFASINENYDKNWYLIYVTNCDVAYSCKITTLVESLIFVTQITRRDEEMTPFVADVKRNYIFGGICPIAANLSIKVCLYSNFCWSIQKLCG